MIDLEEYRTWDGTRMAELVRAGEVRPDELRDACDAVMEQWDPLIHAVADRAPAPDESDPSPDAVLPGVPFAVKELLAVPGLPWTLGSRLFAGTQVTERSPYVERLLATGAQVVCSATSSELGLLGSTESALRGPTVNPWRPGLTAAGSSGGSAAAVAAGIVPFAHASDAGGSIRVPASVNGVFGLKPSNGRCEPSMADAGGFAALVVDHVVTRSVRDSATLLAATERTGPGAVFAPVGRVEGPSARRRRIGVLSRTLLGEEPAPEIAAALTDTAALCASLGHGVVELAPPPVDGPAVSDAFFTSAAVAMAALSDMVTPMLGRPPGPDELEPFTLELVAWARTLPAGAAERAADDLARARAAYLTVFDHCDLVLTPTLTMLPWELGFLAPDLGREELITRTGRAVGYTPIHNAAGCPAMSVPLAWVDDLPVGMHVAAAPGAEAALLELAYELEAARPWADRRPDAARFEEAGAWRRS